jgi:hypothetical protein
MSGHSEGKQSESKLFCALRTDKCLPCKNKYKQPCEKAAKSWPKYAQKHRTKGAVERSHEAHHILCVAAVTGQLVACSNASVKRVVENTKWCVNQPKNMIALPMWGHTFTWYVDLDTGKHRAKKGPPPFANLTQHNYDHGPYLEEVEKELKRIASNLKEGLPPHPEKPNSTLAGALDGLITKYKPKLKKSSTHESWKKGREDPKDKEWYKPFSMASNPTPLDFPFGDNDLMQRLEALIKAYLKLP